MKRFFTVFSVFLFALIVSTPIKASEFEWMADLNVKAEADLSGFKASLAARFNLDSVKIETIIKSVEKPADAYMVLKLGEMSGRPPEYVLNQYKGNKKEGWGKLAKRLGIKPGSAEFHSLKKGHDLYRKAAGEGKGKKGR